MTEYDFSDEGRDRYMRKMQTVSRWVDRQADAQYGNPFVPSVSRSSSGSSAAQSLSPERLNDRYSSPDSHTRSSRSRSPPSSSYAGGDSQYSYTTHIYVHPKHRSSHNQSSSRPPPSRSYSYAHPNTATQSHTMTGRTDNGQRGNSLPAQYVSKPGQPVVYQGRGQTYVVIPGSTTSVEVRSPQGISPVVPPQVTYYTPPLRKKPLLQRIFNLGSGSVSASHSRSSSPRRAYVQATDPRTYAYQAPPVRPSNGMRRRSRSMF